MRVASLGGATVDVVEQGVRTIPSDVIVLYQIPSDAEQRMWIALLGGAEADIMAEWFEPRLPNARLVLEIPFGLIKWPWIPHFFRAFPQITEYPPSTRSLPITFSTHIPT